MADSGWGQVRPRYATKGSRHCHRTDLLKTSFRSETGIRSKLNLLDLDACMPPRDLRFSNLLLNAPCFNLPIYLVGGFCDLILRKASPDFDFVIEGDALQLAHALASQYGGKVTSHRQFGTAKWQINSIRQKLMESRDEFSILDPFDLPESIDLISARTEFYDHPTALPTVKQSSIKLDLHRRDFTINTLALRLDGAHYGDLYDFWGGLADYAPVWCVCCILCLSWMIPPPASCAQYDLNSASLQARTAHPKFLMTVGLLQQTSGDQFVMNWN